MMFRNPFKNTRSIAEAPGKMTYGKTLMAYSWFWECIFCKAVYSPSGPAGRPEFPDAPCGSCGGDEPVRVITEFAEIR